MSKVQWKHGDKAWLGAITPCIVIRVNKSGTVRVVTVIQHGLAYAQKVTVKKPAGLRERNERHEFEDLMQVVL